MGLDFILASVFVLYVGVRQANFAMERGATAVKQWSDGDATKGTKGDRVSPFVNHTLAMQGDKAQLTSCAHNLVNWRLPSPLKMTSNLDQGPLTTPKALPAYHATAVPLK